MGIPSEMKDTKTYTMVGGLDVDDGTAQELMFKGDAVLVSLSSASGASTDVEGGGKVAVGKTAVEVTFTGSTSSVIITADKDNTGTLYVGKSDVASDGSNAMTYLEAGDVLTVDYLDTTNALYVVSDTAAQNFWKGALL